MRLFAAAEALREAIGAGEPRGDARAGQALAPARASLGEEAFAAAWATGRALPLADAVAEALRAGPRDRSRIGVRAASDTV